MSELVPHFVVALAIVAVLVALWSTRWPTVEGKIEVSIFDREWEGDVSGGRLTVERRGKHYLAYTYTVGDQLFQSSRIAPIAKFEWQVSGNPEVSSARDDSRWYREGGAVTVYYCPFWPRWSCVEPGGFIIAALLGLIAGVSYFVS